MAHGVSVGSTLKCSYDNVKLEFYRAFNALFCRSHCSNSELVTIELVKAYCLSLLLYAGESTAPAKQDIRMMDRCIDAVVRKIFRLSCFEECA